MKNKSKNKKPVVVAVSGGFDPLHVGHLKMFEEAKKLGDYLVVILNNDNWLRAKKGFVFMPEKERATIIKGLRCVDAVYLTGHRRHDTDRSVTRELAAIRPAIFANGGDRKNVKDIPEAAVCKKYGIKMKFNVGGGKVQSSSWLTSNHTLTSHLVDKPWGFMQTFRQEKKWWVKTLTLRPGQRISLQTHKHRGEFWVAVEGSLFVELGETRKNLKGRFLPEGAALYFGQGAYHRACNTSKKPVTFVEVVYGTRADEADIVRYDDDYGRKHL